MARFTLAVKAARQLGIRQILNYARYQTGLRTGHYRRATSSKLVPQPGVLARSPFKLPDRSKLLAVLNTQPGTAKTSLIADLLAEADEITAGSIRLFGGQPAFINLKPPRLEQALDSL